LPAPRRRYPAVEVENGRAEFAPRARHLEVEHPAGKAGWSNRRGLVDPGKENAVMISKVLAATLVASLTVPVAATAAQSFGRDSVYASRATATRAAPAATQVTRAGRDSVYATQPVAGRRSFSTAHSTTVHYGRA
jgi:hypothetical protein